MNERKGREGNHYLIRSALRILSEPVAEKLKSATLVRPTMWALAFGNQSCLLILPFLPGIFWQRLLSRAMASKLVRSCNPISKNYRASHLIQCIYSQIIHFFLLH